MPKLSKQTVRKHLRFLVENIDVASVADHLFQEKVFKLRIYEKVRKAKTTRERCRILLTKLLDCKDKKLPMEHFRVALLDDKNNHFVLRKLEGTEKETMVRDSALAKAPVVWDNNARILWKIRAYTEKLQESWNWKEYDDFHKNLMQYEYFPDARLLAQVFAIRRDLYLGIKYADVVVKCDDALSLSSIVTINPDGRKIEILGLQNWALNELGRQADADKCISDGMQSASMIEKCHEVGIFHHNRAGYYRGFCDHKTEAPKRKKSNSQFGATTDFKEMAKYAYHLALRHFKRQERRSKDNTTAVNQLTVHLSYASCVLGTGLTITYDRNKTVSKAQLQEAKHHLREVEDSRELYGAMKDRPKLLFTVIFADVYYFEGNYTRAVEECDKALTQCQNLVPINKVILNAIRSRKEIFESCASLTNDTRMYASGHDLLRELDEALCETSSGEDT